jgi:hypothetical protein
MSYSLEDRFEIDPRTIEGCSIIIDRINEACRLLALTIYPPAEDISDYEPKSPKTVDNNGIAILDHFRKEKRWYSSRFSETRKDKFPWERKKMNYDSQTGLQFVFCVTIADGEMTFVYEPSIHEVPYCGKGYGELVKKMDDVSEKIEEKHLELVQKGAELIINNSRKRFLKDKEIMKLQEEIEKELHQKGSESDVERIMTLLLEDPKYLIKLPGIEELENYAVELEQINKKISKTPEKKMKVLKYETLSPKITFVPNIALVKKVPEEKGGIVEFYSEDRQPSAGEMKGRNIVELRPKRRYSIELTEKCKSEVRQNLESLVNWLNEQIASISLK